MAAASPPVQFEHPPSASLQCPICQDIYRDPVITSGCHHSFCASCITQSLTFESNCPLCRRRLQPQDLHPNLALAGLIGELLVVCPHRGAGCTEQVRLESYQSHVRQCRFAPGACQYQAYGCEFSGTAKDVADHTAVCPFHMLSRYILATDKRIAALESLVATQSAEIESLKSQSIAGFGTNAGIETSAQPSAVKDAAGGGEPAAQSSSGIHFGSRLRPRVLDDPWPMGDIACVSTISATRSGVTAVAAVGERVYAGAYDGKIRAFSLASGDLLHAADAHSLSVWSLAAEPLSNRLYSAGTDGYIKVWDIQNEQLSQAGGMSSHNGKVYSLALHGNLLLSASSDKTIKLWNLQTLECTATLSGHTAGVNSIRILPGDRLASVSSDKSIKIWDLQTGTNIHSISHLPSEALDIVHGSGLLFASTLDANITAYNLNDYSRAGLLSGHRWEVWQLEYTSGALFSGSHDHTIKRWDIRSFQPTADLTGHKGYIHSLVAGDACLISGCGDKSIKVWGSKPHNKRQQTLWINAASVHSNLSLSATVQRSVIAG
ncbi:quinon protein alcohol dehydrogenase-like superfamily [Entophlyctis helioformis]|nr:quinon protein alcohol dehydrogenase-like superfamily [Entophlyctis helioformis]